MSKSLPDPIQIRIDTQEQRSGIPALLAAMPQVHIELTPLTYITARLRVPILPEPRTGRFGAPGLCCG